MATRIIKLGSHIRHFLRGLPPLTKKMLILGLDLALIPIALWSALSLRLGIWYTDAQHFSILSLPLVLLTVPIFIRLGLYRAIMRYVGQRAFLQIAKGVFGSAVILLIYLLLADIPSLPQSLFVVYGLLLFLMIGGSRWLARSLLGDGHVVKRGKPVAIYGAGETGRQLANMLRLRPDCNAVLFIDDDPSLVNRDIDNIPVELPHWPDMARILSKHAIKEIFLAIPTASRARRREILELLEPLAVHVRSVPSIGSLLAGQARLDELQEVQVEDLLGRDPVPPLPNLLRRCISGKTVLVTGAGGTIGAELCRQIAQLEPACLLLLDHCEFALYKIEAELCDQVLSCEPMEIVPLLGSVTDAARLSEVFSAYAVDTVYHAAAYKHVPMVEHNPIEGVRNNVFGTLRIAEQARERGVNHFVLISTDKAVRPTNVMGASKRLAEMALQELALTPSLTIYSIVRFGNVLGSSGSVVPRFRQQIAEGGPVTVTHPEVTRYFMTIPEAVQLVIQAGAMAGGGDVFLLDMGEPVLIRDLAKRMIRLSGLEVMDASNPEGDIEIRYTGLRPGEKLFEELLIGANATGTMHPRISRAEEETLSSSEYHQLLQKLERAIDYRDVEGLRKLLLKGAKGYRAGEIADPIWLRARTTSSQIAQIHVHPLAQQQSG